MKINYSIIIPHKNIISLLNRLIGSIPQRNDVEIIVVDNSVNPILREDILSTSENIKLLYSDSTKGAGHARNIGIKEAQGKWLIFADADDFFNPCFNQILDIYIYDKTDIIFFKANSVDTETYIPQNRANHLNRYIDLFRFNQLRATNLLKYKFGEPWSKFINKKIVDENDIKFDELPIHNDTTFSYLIGYYAINIKTDARALYCVTERKGSVSKNDKNIQKKLCRILVFTRASLFFQKHNIPIEEDRHIQEMVKIFLFDNKNFKEVNKIFTSLNYSKYDIFKQLFRSCHFRFYNKLLFILKKI